MARVCGTWENIKAKPELSDPPQSLVIGRLQDASFNTVEGDVAMDVIKDHFFKLLAHFLSLALRCEAGLLKNVNPDPA